jgi:large subunit ribosomal protein LX
LAEVKVFRITGEVKKPRNSIPFDVKIRATKERDAIERMYTDLGSRHKARRLEIKFKKIEELKATGTETAENVKR